MIVTNSVSEKSLLLQGQLQPKSPIDSAVNDVIRQVPLQQSSEQVTLGAQVDKPSTYEGLGVNSVQPQLRGKPVDGASKDEPTEEQEKAEDQEVEELKARDTEVRLHEQAHAAVGGQYAGSPSYEYETGPDGRQYAVGGEVSIDVSEEEKPEDTVSKMQVVRAAALAPAEPSTQDYKVAAEASQKEQLARAEIAKQSVSGDDSEGEPSQPKNATSKDASSDNSLDVSNDYAASKAAKLYQTMLDPISPVFNAQA